MQQVARGIRAKPRDLAKPREHIFTLAEGTSEGGCNPGQESRVVDGGEEGF